MKGHGRKRVRPNLRCHSVIWMKGQRKITTTLVRTVDFLTDIRHGHLHNTSQNCYLSSQSCAQVTLNKCIIYFYLKCLFVESPVCISTVVPANTKCSAVYILQYTFCSIHSAVYILQYTFCSIHPAVYILQYTFCSIHSAVYILQYTFCSIHPSYNLKINIFIPSLPLL